MHYTRLRSIILAVFLSIFCIASSNLTAQSTDPMETLNLLAFGSVGQLKYQMGGKPGGEAVDLDDSGWDVTFPGYKWPQGNTNVWFRSTAIIPEKLGGFSLIGRKMTLYLYIDNGGDVFVNGDSLGTFEWGTAEFVVSENLQPGDTYVMAVRGINRPGWGKVSEYRIEYSGMEAFQKKLQDKVWGLMIAKHAAQTLSEKPDYWINEIDKTAERIINSDAYKSGDENAFLAVFDEENKGLDGLKKELEQYKIFAAGYAHIDLAWLWPWIETVEVVKNTSESVLNIMDRVPEFKYSMGQAHAYEWMEIYYPKLFKAIQDKVKQGKWEIVGGQWVEPDGNIPSGESFVRQSLYGKRYFRDKFGVDVKVCWLPDTFGFNWNLPQILARSGMEAFLTKRYHLDDSKNFPHRLFRWSSPDGSSIIAYCPRDGYMHDLNGEQLVDFLADEKTELDSGRELVLYGVGNHGGGPTMEMLERGLRAQSAPAYPQVELVDSKSFFDAYSVKEKANLANWNNELYLERFRGCYTSQAKTKQHNRKSQVMIKTAEKSAAIASLYGYTYPSENIFDVWRTIMFNQFHDILPGTSIPAVYHDTEIEYTKAEQLAGLITQRSMQSLAEQIDTRGKGEALLLFNPLSWDRSGPVEIELDDLDKEKMWSVLDEHGNAVASQIIEKSALGAKLLFIAKEVPSYGYKVYRLVEGHSTQRTEHLEFTRTMLENRHLRIEIDKSTGLVSRIYDRNNAKEVLANDKGNQLQLLPNDTNDAWNVHFSKPPINIDNLIETELVEVGPVRATIKVKSGYCGGGKRAPTEDFPTSFFTQYISLYDGLPYMEVRNEVVWWEDQKVLKVKFPLNVQADTARYEIPYGSIGRPTGTETAFEKARYEVPAQRWADLSDGSFGVSLINDCKHGYDIKGSDMRLSLLRAPTYPDPLADRGYQHFNYAIYPHKGDYVQGNVTRQGYAFNEPIYALRTGSHKGSLSKSYSFVQIDADNVILNALKKSEDDNDWIVRVYETAGQSTSVNVTFDRQVSAAQEVNLIEDPIGDVKTIKNGFTFDIKPREIRSFKVRLDSDR